MTYLELFSPILDRAYGPLPSVSGRIPIPLTEENKSVLFQIIAELRQGSAIFQNSPFRLHENQIVLDLYVSEAYIIIGLLTGKFFMYGEQNDEADPKIVSLTNAIHSAIVKAQEGAAESS